MENNNYTPTTYEYKQFKITLNFNESDVNERYIYYVIQYIDSDGYKCHDFIIRDRDTEKLWFDWDSSVFKPIKSKNYYLYQKVVWQATYCKLLSDFKSYFNRFWNYHEGIIELTREYIFKKKNYNNEEFKDFLEQVYRRESVERDLS